MKFKSEWNQIIQKINNFLFVYLSKVEWYYGDCRAPFQYPARFYFDRENTGKFTCEIIPELNGDSPIFFSSSNPQKVFTKVQNRIFSLFGTPWQKDETQLD